MSSKKTKKGENKAKKPTTKSKETAVTAQHTAEWDNITDTYEAAPVNDTHGAVIDQYFINGFNKTQAMLSVNPDLAYNTASVMADAIFSHDGNTAYIQQKRGKLRASTDIRNENLLRELVNWAFVDVTQFMTLDEEQIKDLPPDIKRTIQSFKSTTRTTYNPATKETTTVKTLEIKVVDKKSAMEAIGKHIGFYLLDNEQKRTKINLNKVDATIINGFLEAIEYQQLD